MTGRDARLVALGAAAALALVLLAALAWRAAQGDGAAGTPTATPATTATATTAPTPSPTPSPPATPARTPTPPASPTPTPPSGLDGPPAGYGQSCAASHPWGQQVRRIFICIDSPRPGETVGRQFVLRGYAGGAFENNIVVAYSVTLDDGGRIPASGQVLTPVTYVAPDAGMPGPWDLRVDLGPAATGGGNVDIVVYTESARDGSRVAETSMDLRLQP